MLFKYYTVNVYTWVDDNKTSQLCGYRAFRVLFWQSPFDMLDELWRNLKSNETLADFRRIK